MIIRQSQASTARLRYWLFDLLRVLVTLAMVAAATAAVWWVTEQQRMHPWTRDGQVLGNVIQVAPQVSGPLVAVHVVDNQRVAKGDPLFDIEPTLFAQQARQAEADLAQAQAAAEDAATDARRAARLHARGELADEDYDLKQAQQRSRAAAVDAARSALETARMRLSFTKVTAPAAGFVTNLELVPGTYAAAGVPQVALIDPSSFWVAGYFKETDLPAIHPGDPAAVVLMGHPDRPLAGRVQSIAYGIARRNLGDGGSDGKGHLADVSPTFEWIRLAQRIPVRIELTDPPVDLPLRIGSTASVSVNPARDKSARTATRVSPQPAAAGDTEDQGQGAVGQARHGGG